MSVTARPPRESRRLLGLCLARSRDGNRTASRAWLIGLSRADTGRSTSETECSFLFARGYSTKGKAPPTGMSEASRDSVGGGANDSRAYLIADL